MTTVKQCDRCEVIMREDFGVRMMKVIRVKKVKPFSFDLCDDCIEEFKKFLDREKK